MTIDELKEAASQVKDRNPMATRAWGFAEYNMTNKLDPEHLAAKYWYDICITEGRSDAATISLKEILAKEGLE